MKHSKLGLIFSLTYLVIFLSAAFYAIYLIVYHPADSQFAGLWAVFVTLPWSLISISIISLEFIIWYNQFASNPAVYGFFAMLTLLPGALLNTIILYFVGKLLGIVAKKIARK